MLRVLLLLILNLRALAVLACSAEPEELTARSFFQKVSTKGGRSALVEIYSPTCPYCVRFVEDYKCVAEQLSSAVLVAKIRSSVPEMESYFTSVPTFRFFPSIGRSTSGIAYAGPRNKAALVAWAKKMAAMDVQALLNQFPRAFQETSSAAANSPSVAGLSFRAVSADLTPEVDEDLSQSCPKEKSLPTAGSLAQLQP